MRIDEARKRTHIEVSRDFPSETGARILSIDDGKIIADIVTDDDRIVDALIERGDDVAELCSAPQLLLGEAVDLRRGGGNGAVRIDE